MEPLFDTLDFPRSSTDAIAPPASDYLKTTPSNSTLFRSGGTHWRCAYCAESVLYSLANGHVEHVRMWTCCQCGFAENRVSLWAACSMCDATSFLDNYACHYPSALEITTDGAMHDSVTYEGSDMARVKVPTMGDSLGLRAADDLVSTVQQNLSSYTSFFDGHQDLGGVEVLEGYDDTGRLMWIDDENSPGLRVDRAGLIYGCSGDLLTSCGIEQPDTAYPCSDAGITTTISYGGSSSTISALTKTSLTPITITAVTRQDLDSGYGSRSNMSTVDKASRKRANEVDHQIPPESDTIKNNKSPPSRKKPRRRRLDIHKRGLACPFYVRNPHRCANNSCVGPGFLGIHRLREHLERVHLYLICDRCGTAFQANGTGRHKLATHQRNTQPCQLAERPSAEIWGLSHAIFEVMRSKKGAAGKSEEERWREIYRLIFPDADEKEMRSAYVDKQSAVQGYRDQHDKSTRCEGLNTIPRELLSILPARLNEIIASRLDDVRLTAIWREFADDQLGDVVEATLADLSSPKQVLPSTQTTLDQEKAYEETNDLSWLDLVDYAKLQ